MTARDSWGQVAHNLRILADSIDAAIEPAPVAVPAAEGASAVPPPRSSAPDAPLPPRKPQESAFTECPAHRKQFTEGKFGPYVDEVNMAWLWARFKARSFKLGYFSGGFQAFCDALLARVGGSGSRP